MTALGKENVNSLKMFQTEEPMDMKNENCQPYFSSTSRVVEKRGSSDIDNDLN